MHLFSDDDPCCDSQSESLYEASMSPRPVVPATSVSPQVGSATNISPQKGTGTNISSPEGTALLHPAGGYPPSTDEDESLDIGVFLKRGKLQSLSQSMKVRSVNHIPDSKFSFPRTYLNGFNRRFKPEWVQSHSRLHYSASEDGVYCALFAPSESNSKHWAP